MRNLCQNTYLFACADLSEILDAVPIIASSIYQIEVHLPAKPVPQLSECKTQGKVKLSLAFEEILKH